MASRGRGHRGRSRGSGQTPPVFDQQAFTEAVGTTAAAIAQAGIAGSKEQNIGIYGYIGTWILRKYRKYRWIF